jgi:hypothetical protein
MPAPTLQAGTYVSITALRGVPENRKACEESRGEPKVEDVGLDIFALNIFAL